VAVDQNFFAGGGVQNGPPLVAAKICRMRDKSLCSHRARHSDAQTSVFDDKEDANNGPLISARFHAGKPLHSRVKWRGMYLSGCAKTVTANGPLRAHRNPANSSRN